MTEHDHSIERPESSEPKDTKFAEAAAARLGLRVEGEGAVFDGQSLLKTLGGWTGIIESTIPPTAFLALFTITRNTVLAVTVAGALALIFIVKQVVTRKPVIQALAGAAGIAIATYLALHGSAKDYYLGGFLTNAVYLVVYGGSALVGWPVIGLAVGFFKGWGIGWRKNKALMTRFKLVSLLWVGVFGTRLLIEVPLYLANNIEALGITKLVLSEPFYALALWFTWLSLRSVILTKP
jgi:Protein of unknown function (DUF3159)